MVAADVVVGVAEGRVNANRFEAFINRFGVALLKAVDPTEKRVRLGGRVGFDGAAVKLNRFLIVFGELRA